jgi:hypothetical protein
MLYARDIGDSQPCPLRDVTLRESHDLAEFSQSLGNVHGSLTESQKGGKIIAPRASQGNACRRA